MGDTSRQETFEIFLFLLDLQYVMIKDGRGKEDWLQITKKNVKVVGGNPSIEILLVNFCDNTYIFRINETTRMKGHFQTVTAVQDMCIELFCQDKTKPIGLKSNKTKPIGLKSKSHESSSSNDQITKEIFLKKRKSERIRENNKKFSRCDICLQQCKGFRGKVDHIINEHGNYSPWKCLQCGMKFAFIKTIFRHMKTVHNNSEVQCNICCKTYHTPQSLSYHVRRHVPKILFTK